MTRKAYLQFVLVSVLLINLACSLVDNLVSDEAGVVENAQEVEEGIPPTDTADDAIPTEVIIEVEVETEFPEEDIESQSDQESTETETVFPLPEDVQNFTGEGGESQINFQTGLSLKETIEFFRQAFAEDNLSERTINTSITDAAFSMVFDGHGNGLAIVIQGVDLGNGTTNINIRFEDL